ncbi:hypothetical protein FF2_045706 [Malus domestica]
MVPSSIRYLPSRLSRDAGDGDSTSHPIKSGHLHCPVPNPRHVSPPSVPLDGRRQTPKRLSPIQFFPSTE